MKGIQVSGSRDIPWTDLRWVLQPIAAHVDQCWWYLGGAGTNIYSLLPPLPEQNLPPFPPKIQSNQSEEARNDHESALKVWKEALKAAVEKENKIKSESLEAVVNEYSRWINDECGYRVGIPGWFSRYAGIVDVDWNCYLASDDNSGRLPRTTMNRIDESHGYFLNWSQNSKEINLPQDICIICNIMDCALWEIIFRDEWMHQAVRSHLLIQEGISLEDL
jgi:hypothetical protein